jgi:hypothetical protein
MNMKYFHIIIMYNKVTLKSSIFRLTRGTSTAEDKPYHSAVQSKALGPNSQLRRGPNDDLLL